jgi:hypothetical protein
MTNLFAAFDMASGSAIARRYRRARASRVPEVPEADQPDSCRPTPLFREVGRPATGGGAVRLVWSRGRFRRAAVLCRNPKWPRLAGWNLRTSTFGAAGSAAGARQGVLARGGSVSLALSAPVRHATRNGSRSSWVPQEDQSEAQQKPVPAIESLDNPTSSSHFRRPYTGWILPSSLR